MNPEKVKNLVVMKCNHQALICQLATYRVTDFDKQIAIELELNIQNCFESNRVKKSIPNSEYTFKIPMKII